ncbi:hypothetical protein Prudu_000117 [Prunus dulcis]|uniref:Uncharacterized protein n=1 Tax=Prunus dulcis TaxID=3755 RepID=A0A4Y1QKH6_PRUDU|nr:hypothetical protein Prudu_000117 [Prunus dulcis]
MISRSSTGTLVIEPRLPSKPAVPFLIISHTACIKISYLGDNETSYLYSDNNIGPDKYSTGSHLNAHLLKLRIEYEAIWLEVPASGFKRTNI